MDLTCKPPLIVRGNMDSLIAALPSLVRKGAPRFGTNSDAWRRWMKGTCYSDGERLAAAFVLFVWNHYTNRKERSAFFRFDLALAMNLFDPEHLAAFSAWAANPWFA